MISNSVLKNAVPKTSHRHPVGGLLIYTVVFFCIIQPTMAEFSVDQMDMRAQLSPQRFTTLSAELGAKIDSISVREGQAFKAGQVLVQFDCKLQKARLDKAIAQLSAMNSVYNGNKRLSELKAIGDVELQGSHAEMLKARADVTFLKTTLDKCSIKAPWAGRAVEQKARAQQFVKAGEPLLEIIDDSVLEVEFIAPSRWLVWLKPGYSFSVHIDETENSYPVKLLGTAARVDPVSQTVKVVAVIDGTFPELVAGMSGRVLIPHEDSKQIKQQQ